MRALMLITFVACVCYVGKKDVYAKTGKLPSVFKERATRIAAGMRNFVLPSAERHSRLQQLIAGAGLAVMACTGLSCENIAGKQYLVNDLRGQEVHFRRDANHDTASFGYIGYVDEVVSVDEVRLKGVHVYTKRMNAYVSTGRNRTINTNQISGVRVFGHEDEGKTLYTVAHDANEVYYGRGIAIKVFSDDYLVMLIDTIIIDDYDSPTEDAHVQRLFKPRITFAQRDWEVLDELPPVLHKLLEKAEFNPDKVDIPR